MKTITCPGEFIDTITEDGEGFGSTKEEALKAARAQASTKLTLAVANHVCDGDCNREETTEPDYDSSPPSYKPWPDPDSSGIKCTIKRSKKVTIKCTPKGTSFIPGIDGEFIQQILPFPAEGEFAAEDIDTLLAFVSASEETIFVKTGCAEVALERLGAVQGKDGWHLPNVPKTFLLNEVEISSKTNSMEFKQLLALLKKPKPGDQRVRNDYKCGPTQKGHTGKCRPVLGGKFYIQGSRTDLAFCQKSTGDECVEYYRETGTVGYYEDSECTKLLLEYSIYSWTCLK